jgi:hypothetical protein
MPDHVLGFKYLIYIDGHDAVELMLQRSCSTLDRWGYTFVSKRRNIQRRGGWVTGSLG